MKTKLQLMASMLAIQCLLLSHLEAATLTKSLYLTLPWGSWPGEVGRYVPREGEDAQVASPCSFSVDQKGNVYISDIQNNRVQIFQKEGKFIRAIQFSKEKNDLPAEIDVDSLGRIYVIVDFNSGEPEKRRHKLVVYDTSGKMIQEFDLEKMGLKLPLHVQRGDHEDIFVGDNDDFQTFRISLTGQVLEKRKDDRVFWLRTKGLYNYDWDIDRVTVYSSGGQRLINYKERVELLGVDSAGNLYTLYKKHNKWREPPVIWLSCLSPQGHELYRIQVPGGIDASLLDPSRFEDEASPRIGQEGAIYVVGDPQTEDQFRIYRYEVKE